MILIIKLGSIRNEQKENGNRVLINLISGENFTKQNNLSAKQNSMNMKGGKVNLEMRRTTLADELGKDPCLWRLAICCQEFRTC